VDGVYGPQTKKAAVKILQRYLNNNYGAKLSVDGGYGALTAAAVRKTKINIAKGSKAKTLVYLVQGMLYANGYSPTGFDGIFGGGTFAALKSYQSAKGLAADGVAGPNTLNKMFS
jgi:peptidoglycan hydrolase-like protein with peptidoglycan-binding domain